MIKSLKLTNWRSHGDTMLEFSPGTNLLMGIMGSGKSSVLSAICFSLFGTFPELERKKLKLEDILRLNENFAGTAIELEFNGNRYKIERRIAKDKRGMVSDATAHKNDAVVEKGAMAVTRLVEEILQVDYDLFTRAIYSEQNNIDYFLTLDPRRRKEEIDILLGLDRFETARANSVSLINRLKAEIKMLEERFSKDELEAVKQRLADAGAKLALLQAGIEKIKQQVAKTRGELAQRQKTFSELSGKRQKHDELARQKTRLEGVMESLKGEILDIDELAPAKIMAEKAALEKQRAQLLDSLKNADKELFRLSKEFAAIDGRMQNSKKNNALALALENEMKRAANGSGIEDIRTSVAKCESEFMRCSSEKATVQSEMKELAAINENIVNFPNCPMCGSEIDAGKVAHLLAERKERLALKGKHAAELDAVLKATATQLESERKKVRDIESIIERINLLKRDAKEEDLQKLQDATDMLERKIAEVQNAKDLAQKSAEENARQLQGKAVELSRLEAAIAKKKTLAEAGEKIKILSAALGELAFDENSYEHARTSLEETRLLFERMLADAAGQEKESTMLSESKAALTREAERMGKAESERSRLLGIEEELLMYKNALLETQFALRTELTEAINAAMAEIWHIFYPYRDYSAVRLNVSDRDYELEVFDGEWKKLESVASGGERACAALALRVALSMVLTPNLSMLILDEPTHNLDKEAVELLSQTLQFKVPEVVEQTFVITHDEALMGSEFASSYKLVRDKAGFGATSVEKI